MRIYLQKLKYIFTFPYIKICTLYSVDMRHRKEKKTLEFKAIIWFLVSKNKAGPEDILNMDQNR